MTITKTINEMVTEDQRDVSMRALDEIIERSRAIEHMEDLPLEEIARKLNGTLAVIRFIAHSTLSSVKQMDVLR